MTYVLKRAAELGLPIVDGLDPMLIAITQSDVLSALKANSKQCALSRAATRVAGVQAAYFFRTRGYLEYRDRMVRYSLPPSVQKEIVSFDRCKMFAPGVYQLTPLGNLREREASRDRTKDITRDRERRQVRKPPKPKIELSARDRAHDSIEKITAGSLGDLPKLAAFIGLTDRPRIAKATKQTGAGRTTLVNKTRFVRTLDEP